MNKIMIEEYAEKYRQKVVKLILEIQRNEFDINITIDDQQDLLNISEFYRINNGNFWIARINDSIIGTISLLDIGNNHGALRKMFVAKNYRGKEFQVGQELLETLLTWAKKHKLKEVFLGTTQKFIAAHRFYEKNGFKEIPQNELPLSFPVMSVDVKFYQYTF